MKKIYLREYKTKQVSVRGIRCIICGVYYVFLDGEKLDDDAMDNVKEEWKALWGVKCNMCEKVFSDNAEFDTHYLNSYNMIPVYTCSYCNKTIEKYTTFRSHCYRHITEGRYK